MRGVTRASALPVLRTLPWPTLAAAGGVGLLLAAVPRLTDGTPGTGPALSLLRCVALAGALGLAFLLDDPARHTTAAVPVRRLARQALRAALAAPPVALWWVAAVLLVPAEIRPPVGDVTLEAAAVCLLTLAGAAAGVRLTDRARLGPGVAAGLLASAVLAPLLLPERWALFVPVGDERWAAAHDRWALLLAAAVAAWGLYGAERVGRHR
ncbi:ABC transporter [Streptomyces sp. NPDC005876]|uniref:ABC transporter n=1 Tax=Streptomyces sp. NPDC005876 TaxID=3157076 RepID=UPI003406A742